MSRKQRQQRTAAVRRMRQNARQSRQKLLEREKLAAQRERNQEQRTDGRSGTVPELDAPTRSSHSPHSTVPEKPQGSPVDPAPRL